MSDEEIRRLVIVFVVTVLATWLVLWWRDDDGPGPSRDDNDRPPSLPHGAKRSNLVLAS